MACAHTDHKWGLSERGIECRKCKLYYDWQYLRRLREIYGDQWKPPIEVPERLLMGAAPVLPVRAPAACPVPVPVARPVFVPAARPAPAPVASVAPVPIPAPVAQKPKPQEPERIERIGPGREVRYLLCLFEGERQSAIATRASAEFDRLVDTRFPYTEFSAMETVEFDNVQWLRYWRRRRA